MTTESGYYRHGLMRMRGREVSEKHRVASSLELIFDLVFAAAFGVAGVQLSHGYATGHIGASVLAFGFAMAAIVWAWINFSWFSSAFDTDDWLFRVTTMVQMAGVIVLAIGLPDMFASIDAGQVLNNQTMVLGYVIMRIALTVQWLRVARQSQYRTAAGLYIGFVGTAQIGWVLLALAPLSLGTSAVCAIFLFLLEWAGPVLAERKAEKYGAGSTPWHPHHIAERYSLLTIVTLGETVIGTIAAAQDIQANIGWAFDTIVVIGAGVAMTFALWWTYFLVPAGEVLAVRRDKSFVWGYGHAIIFASIAAIGAALHLLADVFREEHPVTVQTAIWAIAIPVIIFTVALYALHTYLVGASSRNLATQIVAVLLPVAGMVGAASGLAMWQCLLLVLAGPASMVVAYETGNWRTLEEQLQRVLLQARERSVEASAGAQDGGVRQA